ncbi:MAG: hypothetical protein JWM34_2906 [Ilumatobacteraceae bacterium]|nr:hypothetical protein [Ilumatobacteraceae bacterium]
MKVLVATHITQGEDADDYCWTVDGELVSPIGLVCNNVNCGCSRGFPGLGSSRATTTALVVDLPHIGWRELTDAVNDSLHRGGWLDHAPIRSQITMIESQVDAIIEVAQAYPVGTVVCRDGDEIYARESLAA